MDMELISRETIKPFPPTPSHLKLYTLSFIDAILFRNYLPFVFFYNPNQHCDQASRILLLKKSLSKVLSKYYHFAGRLRDQFSIDCNDQGVSFLVTRIKGKLSENIKNHKEESLKPLFPDELPWNESSSEGFIAIQVNCFESGGMAISVCASHKILDIATVFNFMNDWATMAKMQSEEAELPFPPVLDIGPSVFSQEELPIFQEMHSMADKNSVSKRFVLEGSKIDSLKAMVSSQNVHNPTRVQVATTLVYKCLVSALGLSFNNSCFSVAVNLRKRMVPPLPEKSVGNLVWWYFVLNPLVEGRETELHDLVSKMRRGLSEFCDTIPKRFGGKDKDPLFISECLKQATSSLAVSDMVNQTFFITSWCGYRMYEVDFGWGKPLWVSTMGSPSRNAIALMDTRDGKGVEVYVALQHKDMARFERDAELLRYATLNPTIDFE